MSDGETPFIRSSEGERRGITEGGDTDTVVDNRLIEVLTGQQLVQFRMGYGVHLELGDAHEVTIETPFEVVEGDTHWGGEPLSADAAGALLALNLREITSGQIAMDGTLVLGVGSATLTVPPQPMYEAWQVRGPDGLLIVCPPGGEYVARLGARAPYIAALPTHAHSRDPVGFRPASPPPTGAWNRRRSRIRTEPLT